MMSLMLGTGIYRVGVSLEEQQGRKSFSLFRLRECGESGEKGGKGSLIFRTLKGKKERRERKFERRWRGGRAVKIPCGKSPTFKRISRLIFIAFAHFHKGPELPYKVPLPSNFIFPHLKPFLFIFLPFPTFSSFFFIQFWAQFLTKFYKQEY